MAVKVDVETDSVKKLLKEIDEFIVSETNDLSKDLYDVTVSNTPVKTGAAKAAWEEVTITQTGQVGGIGNPKDYLRYVEDGTPHQSAQKFIERSIIKVLNTRK